MKLLAKTFFGLEKVLANELERLGAEDIVCGKRAVSFSGDYHLLYRANLELRTAVRILMPIKSFSLKNETDLYNKIQQINWNEYMKVTDTLAIDGVSFSEQFTHSKYVALKTKDAIVDQFRDKFDERPNIDVRKPKLKVNIHINRNNECTVSLDSSGESLHKRGYRSEALEAPINEVLAAGMILLSDWKCDSNFIDPMCGSGTILMEAATYAYQIAPQIHRDYFCFKHWKNFNSDLWERVLADAKKRERSFNFQILGFDKSFQAIRVTQRNILTAYLEGKIEVNRKQFEKLIPPSEAGIVIMNPPYDQRLQEGNIDELYKMIGDQLKHQFSGYKAWMITSNREAMKHFGLRPSKKIVLFNASLECRFYKFELYKGSRKASKA